MRYKFKRCTTFLVVICMILTMIVPMKAYAVGDLGNSGGGSGGALSGSSGLTYADRFSGYRIYLTDDKFQQVSNTVDLQFTNPPSGSFGSNNVDFYTGTRANGQWYSQRFTAININTLIDSINAQSTDGVMFGIPSTPIRDGANGGKVPGGEDFKCWFLGGKDAYREYHAPQQSYSGNGVTSPTLHDTQVQNYDMPPGDVNLIVRNPSYRRDIKARAEAKLQEQGFQKHAQKIIVAEVEALRDAINYFMLKGYNYNQIYYSAIKTEISYVNNISYTNAEATYILCQIIDSVFGYDWYFGQRSNLLLYKDTDVIQLDEIPLANEFNSQDNQSSKACSRILNYTYNGNALFRITDANIALEANRRGLSEITHIMDAFNLYIVVEPVFWLVPRGHGGSPTHRNWVYGSVGNFIDFHAYHNYKFGDDGGSYQTMLTKLGWSSMYYSEQPEGASDQYFPKAFQYKDEYQGITPISTLYDWKNGSTKWAIAMHCYKPDPKNGRPPSYQVTGEPTWTTPATAPDSNGKTKRNADGSVWVDENGIPENKDYKMPPQGYEKEYNILKYYEDLYEDGTVEQVAKFIRRDNPPQIDVRDERDYKVRGWFVTTNDLKDYQENNEGYFECPEDDIYTYEQAKDKFGYTKTGDKQTYGNPVFLDQNKLTSGSNGEKTLVVVLQRPIKMGDVNNPLTLNESEISKSITTMDTNIPNWGPRHFTFEYRSMSDSDTHYCSGCSTKHHSDGSTSKTCHGHSCRAVWGDSYYKYVIWNSATLDNLLEANSAGGRFASKMINNIEDGNVSMGGGANTMSSAEYQTTIWRGEDVPTIASYKENSSIELNNLLKKYDKRPVGSRGLNGSYIRKFNAQLDVHSSSDLENHSVHSRNGNTWHTSTHTYERQAEHSGDVTVNVYRGANKKAKGDTTNDKKLLTTTPFGNTSSIHSSGYMVQQDIGITFYPYIRMTYQTTGDNTKNDVNILSQFYSEVLPNDFAEAAWYNPHEEESLTMSSVQWSLHAKAVNGGQDWNGANQVLPGGAIYQLSTQDYTSKVSLVTWQTIMGDEERSKLAMELPANAYSMNRANSEHTNYVNQAKQVLEGLRIVQWVNGDTKATNAWTNNGQAVKVVDGGENLSPLGLSGVASTEGKHRLAKDGTTDAANEGDLDIVSENQSTDTFFKVFSDTSGNIYFAKSVGDKSALESLNGTNIGNAQKILSKKDKAESVSAKLTGDAKELNDRTNIVTNFVKALERNTGNDPSASWAADGKWYNEAFDGIMVVRKCTTLDVGFNNTAKRTSSVDPNLMPKNKGVGDLFSTAYLSQFRCNEYSDSPIAAGKGNGYIGTFQGKDIYLEHMEDMYKSKKWYIPNVSVQDLN